MEMSSSAVTRNRKPMRQDAQRAITARKACGTSPRTFAKSRGIQYNALRIMIKAIEEETNGGEA